MRCAACARENASEQVIKMLRQVMSNTLAQFVWAAVLENDDEKVHNDIVMMSCACAARGLL